LYCETVVNKNGKLLIPNALTDEEWKNNPDIKAIGIKLKAISRNIPIQNSATACALNVQTNFMAKKIGI